MSNGSQIGGVVGAVIGGWVTGWVNPQGYRYGYAIGSAIGGYVDPTRTYGPRLEDASAQTSSVGGVIPFGYGTYTCSGNIIWADRLIEHKKTERVGKGGSQKNTTYTYTRSYAIGVSETISAYMWIKKNGKLIYAADPSSLGAAMGWSGKQISDLVAASAKFLQMATLYYGTASQMPDSTIVAVEGVGNVSPFRDLAYVVLENEDLTDTRGAVSQYEFCVFCGSDKVYSTPPYPVYVEDDLVVSSRVQGSTVFEMGAGLMGLSSRSMGGTIRTPKREYTWNESTDLSSVSLGGALTVVKRTYTWGNESADLSSVSLGGTLKVVKLPYLNYDPEPITINSVSLGGTLT